MFSFHKPKIYRSNLGCCICKAKSSSSRFTDSKKYENEFERCFRIEEKRSGEICNACVLLVKRWKKLSPENRLTKHWHHVVDARAGPGTKLTGNRRLTSASAHNSSNNLDSINGSQSTKQQRQSGKSDVLPLSSSQANNQSGNGSSTTKTRTNSFNNKARAIDTNVSTFTFGEPQRRSYTTGDSSYSYVSSSSITKPQSALNSSAFESVIKRFRLRQQQQRLDAQRRELNRQQRLQQRSDQQGGKVIDSSSLSDEKIKSLRQSSVNAEPTNRPHVKRFKYSSESIGSLSFDTLRVSSLLDNSFWRKEKICCGYIFRGLHNEVAIFPKLLKPCQCRLRILGTNQGLESVEMGNDKQETEEDLLKRPIESPPPRATKSGSISSCDSNTSGTGSMEQPLDEVQPIKRTVSSSKRPPRSTKTILRQQHASKRRIGDTDSNTSSSSSGASTLSSGKNSVRSPGSSSEASSSRLLLMAGDDDVEEDEELILDEEDACESSNDASSLVESLAEMETKNTVAMS